MSFKITCFTDSSKIEDFKKIFVKAFEKDYFSSMGIDFFKHTVKVQIPKIGYTPVVIYLWVVNIEERQRELLRGYLKGAKGFMLVLDLQEDDYILKIEWFLDNIISPFDKTIPFLLQFKVDDTVLEKAKEKIFEMVDRQLELSSMTDYPMWIDFYTENELFGLAQGLENLVILIIESMVEKKKTRDN